MTVSHEQQDLRTAHPKSRLRLGKRTKADRRRLLEEPILAGSLVLPEALLRHSHKIAS
jgi:hypothetical protein